MANQVNRKKSFSIAKLNIRSIENPSDPGYDLTSIFVEMNIFSNIASTITSGYITVAEQFNLISKMPIVGKEFIDIEFNTMTDSNEYESYHRVFFVYAIDSLSEEKDSRIYCIRFTDAIGILNNDIRLSIQYEEKVEDVIEKIGKVYNYTDKNSTSNKYKNVLEKFDNKNRTEVFNYKKNDETSTDTMHKFKFVIPNWKPLTALQYLTSRTVSTNFTSNLENTFCDCILYQNRHGEIIFTNYKNMFEYPLIGKTDGIITLVKRPGNIEALDDFNTLETKRHILKYTFSNLFNSQIQKSSGQFGLSEYITNFANGVADPVEIPYEQNQTSNCAIKDILKYYNIDNGSYSHYSYEPLNMTGNSLLIYGVSSINTSKEFDEYRKFIEPYQKSIAIRQIIEGQKITLHCLGQSDLDLGKYISIDLGKHDDEAIANYINNLRWVITAITHRITPDSYTTDIECYTPYLNINRKKA